VSRGMSAENLTLWNQRNPIGTPVRLRGSDGTVTQHTTRSEAWLLGHGQAVVLLSGLSGGYGLDWVEPIRSTATMGGSK